MRPLARALRLAALATSALGLVDVAVADETLADRPMDVVPVRAFSFRPDTPDRCRHFLVTEFSVDYTQVKTLDALDDYIFTDSFGLMRNLPDRRAVGASIDAYLALGHVRLAPAIRVKQWLAGHQSVDLSLGYVLVSASSRGMSGAILNARYSPTSWVHAQVGLCRIRSVDFAYPLYPGQPVDAKAHIYAGIGLGGLAGVGAWGAQTVGAVILAALLTGAE